MRSSTYLLLLYLVMPTFVKGIGCGRALPRSSPRDPRNGILPTSGKAQGLLNELMMHNRVAYGIPARKGWHGLRLRGGNETQGHHEAEQRDEGEMVVGDDEEVLVSFGGATLYYFDEMDVKFHMKGAGSASLVKRGSDTARILFVKGEQVGGRGSDESVLLDTVITRKMEFHGFATNDKGVVFRLPLPKGKKSPDGLWTTVEEGEQMGIRFRERSQAETFYEAIRDEQRALQTHMKEDEEDHYLLPPHESEEEDTRSLGFKSVMHAAYHRIGALIKESLGAKSTTQEAPNCFKLEAPSDLNETFAAPEEDIVAHMEALSLSSANETAGKDVNDDDDGRQLRGVRGVREKGREEISKGGQGGDRLARGEEAGRQGELRAEHRPLLETEALPSGRMRGRGGAEYGESVYMTTAIAYTNGPPHIGHAYEAVTADAIARWHRMMGRSVFLLTGTDEHGNKIQQAAEKEGIEPIKLCDRYVDMFQSLYKQLNISYDWFIRTSSDAHKDVARIVFRRANESGDIYLDVYKGWYNTREENFVPECEAALVNYTDTTTGLPLKRVEEPCYFFRLSKYQSKLIEHIRTHEDFLQPAVARNEILERLQKEPLRDLSVSRTNLRWGVEIPQVAGVQEKHVMYVWFDALTNYLTGVAWPRSQGKDGLWPCDLHVIGKDITWFHAVIWPALLMSANIELPVRIFAHGFVNDVSGKKMSKSVGNVASPQDLLAVWPADSLRYYLCTGVPYGADLPLSRDAMALAHNGALADSLGNLVNRVVSLAMKLTNGQVPQEQPPDKNGMPFCVSAVVAEADAEWRAVAIQRGGEVAMRCVRAVNKWLYDEAPWKLKNDEDVPKRASVVRGALEAVYVCAHLLEALLPNACRTVCLDQLHTRMVTLRTLRDDFQCLVPGTQVSNSGGVLFEKVSAEEEEDKNNQTSKAGKVQKNVNLGAPPAAAPGPAGSTAVDAISPTFTDLEFKVGELKKTWVHPDSTKLYCEEIDVGEQAPRQVVSGLRAFYTLEEFCPGRRVIVCTNLKAAKMAGFESQGMVLAAMSPDKSKVELVEPPNDAVIGDRVFIESMEGTPLNPNQVQKKKVLPAVLEHLKTDTDCVVCWKGKPLMTSAGPLKTPTLAECSVG